MAPNRAPQQQRYAALATADEDGAAAAACKRWDEASAWDVMYSWVTPLVARGAQRQLEHADLPPLPVAMRIASALADLRRGLDNSKLAHGAADCLGADLRRAGDLAPWWPWPDGTLIGVVFKVYWKQQLQSLTFEFAREGSAVLVTVALRQVILFMEDPSQPQWHGYLLGLCMFAATQGQAFFMWHNIYIRLVSLQSRGAVMALIFQKAMVVSPRQLPVMCRSSLTDCLWLQLSNAGREKMALGQVVNLMANDSNRLIDFMDSVNG